MDFQLISFAPQNFLDFLYHAYPKFWDDFGWWLEKVGGISVFVAILIFVIEQRNDRRKKKEEHIEKINNSCKTILKELDSVKETFENSDCLVRGEDIEYVEKIITTDAYDSIIQSGLFSNLEPDTQNALSNIYLRLKLRNDMLKHMSKLGDMYVSIDNVGKTLEFIIDRELRYQQTVTIWEKEIKNLLDGVRILLDKELKKLESM